VLGLLSYGVTRKVPGRAVAPGPGSLAVEFTSPSVVAGMQNTAASVVFAGVPNVMGPAGEPFSMMVRQVPLPVPLKQPIAFEAWPVQKKPVAELTVTVSVVSGEKLIARTPAEGPKPGTS
jgi:hypothetical protein